MANMRKWRRHTVECKRQVVERMKTAANINDLARELDLERKLLYTWKYQLEGRPEPRHANLETTAEERKEKKLQDEIAKLKSALVGGRHCIPSRDRTEYRAATARERLHITVRGRKASAIWASRYCQVRRCRSSGWRTAGPMTA